MVSRLHKSGAIRPVGVKYLHVAKIYDAHVANKQRYLSALDIPLGFMDIQ